MLLSIKEVIYVRIWNGLNVNDRVKYKDKEYIVKELYQENDIRYCKLISNDELGILAERVIVQECEKIL